MLVILFSPVGNFVIDATMDLATQTYSDSAFACWRSDRMIAWPLRDCRATAKCRQYLRCPIKTAGSGGFSFYLQIRADARHRRALLPVPQGRVHFAPRELVDSRPLIT